MRGRSLPSPAILPGPLRLTLYAGQKARNGEANGVAALPSDLKTRFQLEVTPRL